jgi:ribosomal protein S18 acetylase RimI-like enzyme
MFRICSSVRVIVFGGVGMSLLRQWATGFCEARGYPKPRSVRSGLWLEMGLRQQSGRYILEDHHIAAFEQAVRSVEEPSTYVEVASDIETLRDTVPTGWTVKHAGTLMALTPGSLSVAATAAAPSGYDVAVTNIGARIWCECRTLDGETAASGLCVIANGAGGVAVFDEICTREPHRRRGLGSAVVSALTRAAAKQARQAVLLATEEGEHLYRRLGWSVISPLTSFISPPNPGHLLLSH